MATKEGTVIHDHAYCIEEEKGVEIEPSDTGNQLESSTVEELESSLSRSPTYSCDSGVDSFANGMAQNFEKENSDLINFLLDDQGFLNLDSDESEDLEVNCDETPKVVLPKPSKEKASRRPTRAAVAPPKSSKKISVNEPTAAPTDREKNAENARENRRRKKEFISGLEKEVGQLRTDKNVLTGKTTRLERKVNQLEAEVDYLKSIIENQSMLSKLLKRVTTTPGVSLSTSFCSSRKVEDLEGGKENEVSTLRSSRKRPCVSQKEIVPSDKRSRKNGSSGGICIHVKQNKVSLEFCNLCSKITED